MTQVGNGSGKGILNFPRLQLMQTTQEDVESKMAEICRAAGDFRSNLPLGRRIDTCLKERLRKIRKVSEKVKQKSRPPERGSACCNCCNCRTLVAEARPSEVRAVSAVAALPPHVSPSPPTTEVPRAPAVPPATAAPPLLATIRGAPNPRRSIHPQAQAQARGAPPAYLVVPRLNLLTGGVREFVLCCRYGRTTSPGLGNYLPAYKLATASGRVELIPEYNSWCVTGNEWWGKGSKQAHARLRREVKKVVEKSEGKCRLNEVGRDSDWDEAIALTLNN